MDIDKLGKFMSAVLVIAILSVVVSNRAKTASVIGSAFETFNHLVGVIVSPVTARQSGGKSGGGSGLDIGGIASSVLDPGSLVGNIDVGSIADLGGFI